MKILVVSQTVISDTTNMGKTFAGYFSDFAVAEIAQLYLRAGMPESTGLCNNYYSFSDSDAIKSIVKRSVHGRRIDVKDIENQGTNNAAVSTEGVYKVVSKHKAWLLLIRDLIWRLSAWANDDLYNWIKEFSPDIIFFAPGDGAFSYRITQTLAKRFHLPFVAVCVDDYFINNRNKGELLGSFRQKRFLKTVHTVFKDAAALFTICDSMTAAYKKLFNKPCYTLHTSASATGFSPVPGATKISYTGNVEWGRSKSLIELGQALHQAEEQPGKIDVYSGTYQPEYIEPLKRAEGIDFHGKVSGNEVRTIMSNSLAVVHTESFEEEYKELVRYSVSTKIADSLMYGPCLIAYGPEGIASIDYLKKNKAAYVITRQEDLEAGLKEILTNKELRDVIICNARALAHKNHIAEVNGKKLRTWLQEAIDKGARF